MIVQHMPDFWRTLSEANAKRNKLWDPSGKIDEAFTLFEMLGEMGEWANNMKKLKREEMGLRGSRITRGEMLIELGDWMITMSLLFNKLGITADEINIGTVQAFNNKSMEMDFPVLINAGGEVWR